MPASDDQHHRVDAVQPGQGRLPLRRRVADPDLPRGEAGRRQGPGLQRRAVPGDPGRQARSPTPTPTPWSSPGAPAARPPARATPSRFVKGMLDESATWAGGGHVPAWLPVQKSAEFRKLKPQSNYTQAAFDAVYDPAGWYTGAGSDFQTAMGSVVASVLAGGTTPRGGVGSMVSSSSEDLLHRPPPGRLRSDMTTSATAAPRRPARAPGSARRTRTRRPHGENRAGWLFAAPFLVALRPLPHRPGAHRPGDQPVQHHHRDLRARRLGGAVQLRATC